MGDAATPLKDILKSVIADLEKKEEEESDFLKAWEKTVGKNAARHTKPVLLKQKRLVVNVSDSSRLYKLSMEKAALIDGFNQNIKDRRKRIRELQFRIGEIREKKEK